MNRVRQPGVGVISSIPQMIQRLAGVGELLIAAVVAGVLDQLCGSVQRRAVAEEAGAVEVDVRIRSRCS